MKQTTYYSGKYCVEKELRNSMAVVEFKGESYLWVMDTSDPDPSLKFCSLISPKTTAIFRFSRNKDKGSPYKYPHIRATKTGRVFWCMIPLYQDKLGEDEIEKMIEKIGDKHNKKPIIEGEAYWYPSFEQIPEELEIILQQEGFYRL